MNDLDVNPKFVLDLRHALRHLYDPTELRASTLTILVETDLSHDPATLLRAILIEAIDATKPDENVPHHSPLWRDHRILFSRFTEQFLQQEVAIDLGLSIRQLRRHEKSAVDALAALSMVEVRIGGEVSRVRQSAEQKRNSSDRAA